MLADSAGSAALALARVKGQGRRIIEEELNRLVRRSPQLTASDVAAIDQALEELHSRLVLARIEQLADRRPDLVDVAVRLFETGAGGGIRLPG